MLVDPSNSAVGAAVTGAVRQASQATGTSFHYLLATAQVESGLNPQAGASTSSARGLFQFIDQTWLATIKQSGDALGYGRYADAITETAPGHYTVADPAMRSEILKLRSDPTANAMMAGAFTKANAAVLAERLGRAPSEGELYIAHFLGAGGAARMVTLAATNPDAKAADFFPDAARANAPIFYDHATGAARRLAQVRNILTARYDVARRAGEGVAAGAQAGAAAAPDTAGMTDAFAAAAPKQKSGDGQIFHGLFQDAHRASPVAPLVSALWSAPRSAPANPAEESSARESPHGDKDRKESRNAKSPAAMSAVRSLSLFSDLPESARKA